MRFLNVIICIFLFSMSILVQAQIINPIQIIHPNKIIQPQHKEIIQKNVTEKITAELSQHMVFLDIKVLSSGGKLSHEEHCSGVVIGPHSVLTAAHCFGATPEEMNLVYQVALHFEKDINQPTQAVMQTTKFSIHHLFNTASLKNSSALRLDHDIALIYFDEPLPPTHQPVLLWQNDDQLLSSQNFATAGYGAQNDVNLKNMNTIPDIGVLSATILKFDFSLPNPKFLPTQITATQTANGICRGDSGGGAFIKSNNNWVLVGITSAAGTDESCLHGKANFTRVSLFQEWIKKTETELSKIK